eukprot:3416074-Karenia_brevis.AAC.1
MVNQSRYDANCAFTDAQVREMLGVPSLECHMRKERLAYLGLLCRHRPKELKALLAVTVRGRRLPWIKLVVEDLQILHVFHGWHLRDMPDPAVYPDPWIDIMNGYPAEWRQLVSKYVDTASPNEAMKRKEAKTSSLATPFVCQ